MVAWVVAQECYAFGMTVVVHHLERSRSHRILWLLEELGVEYELVTYARDPKTMRAPAKATALHPRGRFPMVDLDGRIMAESGAILEALIERFGEGRFVPAPGTEAHRLDRYFLHYAEGSLMPALLVGLITGQLRTKKVPFLVRPVAKAIAGNIDGAYTSPEIKSHVAFLEAELEGRTFITGDELAGADFQMSYPVEALLTRAGATAPNLRAYLERLRARPAFQAALAKGGPVMLDG